MFLTLVFVTLFRSFDDKNEIYSGEEEYLQNNSNEWNDDQEMKKEVNYQKKKLKRLSHLKI